MVTFLASVVGPQTSWSAVSTPAWARKGISPRALAGRAEPTEGVWALCDGLEPRLSQLGMLEAIALHTALAAAPWRPRACSF